MSDSTRSTFEEGDTVILLGDYDHFAYENTPEGEQLEFSVEVTDARATYEVISIDYDRGFLYSLRLDGEADGYDFIRVWSVPESDIQKV